MIKEPVYSNAYVKLDVNGPGGNSFFILGRLVTELKRIDIPKEEIDTITDEVMGGDYKNVLTTVAKYVSTDIGDYDIDSY